jgi:hypothetical protein
MVDGGLYPEPSRIASIPSYTVHLGSTIKSTIDDDGGGHIYIVFGK